jgi:hypothetical protein
MICKEIVLLLISWASATLTKSNNMSALFPDLESYQLDKFPTSKVALHMSCKESNMFATNCACHLRCKEPTCRHAWEICEKYKDSKGCKYVLFRNGQNKIATLKILLGI